MTATTATVVAWPSDLVVVIELTNAVYTAIRTPDPGDRLDVGGAVGLIVGGRRFGVGVQLTVRADAFATFAPDPSSAFAGRPHRIVARRPARVLLIGGLEFMPGGPRLRGARIAGRYLGRPCELVVGGGATWDGDGASIRIGAGDPLAIGRTVEIAAIPQPAAA